MVNTIDVARVQEYFKNNFLHLASQRDSRTDVAVAQSKMINGKQAFFDRVGLTNVQLKVGRHEDSPILDVPHTRRMISLDTWKWGDMIDKSDILRISGDPTSAYLKEAVGAMNRKKDALFISSAIGNAAGDETGSTPVALPAAQLIAHGSAALTVAKLKQAIKILRFNDVDVDNEKMFLFLDSEGIEDLNSLSEYINFDYNLDRNLANGTLKPFMGMNIVHCERLADLTPTTNRLALLVTEQAIGKAIGEETRVQVGERSDKDFNFQLYMEGTLGYTRIFDERVVDIRFQV